MPLFGGEGADDGLPHSPSKSSARSSSSSEPVFRRCCGRGCIKRANLLRLEKLAVTLLVGYALCDLLVFDLNGTTRLNAGAETTATPPGSPSRATAAAAQKPHNCAFVRGAAVPPAGGPMSHRLHTANVEDCCVACSDLESVHFYFDADKRQCWCQGREPSAGVSGARRMIGAREAGANTGSGIVSGEPSCCRALADARQANGTQYEDEFARNYDIGDLNDDGMMSVQEFAQFHVVADANHDGMLTQREFRHWLGKVVGEDDLGDYSGKVTTGLLLHVALVQSVPLVGFGFLDNCIMIVAGDAIDSGVGKALRISTMGAAGLGNLISDVAGLGLEDYVRLISDKIMVTPQLSREQKASPRVLTAQALGGIAGISVGCLLGMAPLLLMGKGSGSGQATEKDKGGSLPV